MRPHRLQYSETKKILDRANRFLAESTGGVLSDPATESQQWIAILFIQIHASGSDAEGEVEDVSQALAHYVQLAEQQIRDSGGYVAAEGENIVLALFRARTPESVILTGIDAAVALMNRLTSQNKARLAQDLASFRIGIGLDSNAISVYPNTEIESNNGLEACIRQARNLCDLNRQTPFPAIFISRNTASRLNGQQRYTVQNLGDVTMHRTGEPLAVYALMPGDKARNP
jgi:class 3 adenylate cyclase